MKRFRQIVIPVVMIISLLPVMFTGCTDEATIPAFLHIDTVMLDSTSMDSVGATTHKIRFAWVYVDDNLQGVYQIPFRVPVIAEGQHIIRIDAGIPENGFSANPQKYIFYDPWIDTVLFTAEDTLYVVPHVKYKHILIPFMENFDNGGSDKFGKEGGQGSYSFMFDGGALTGTGYGYITLAEGESEIICTTKVHNTPKNKLGYFVEMDYKNNCRFSIGVRTSFGGQIALNFYEREEWNKIYINVTPIVDQLPGTDLQFYFLIQDDPEVSHQEVFIDNFKFIYE